MKANPDLSALAFALQDAALSHLPVPLRIGIAMKQRIAEGLLVSGQKLPSSRQLASSLRVSRESVERAYGQLEAEGYLLRQVGSGSYVSPSAIPRLSGRPAGRRGRMAPATALPEVVLSGRGERFGSGGRLVDPPDRRPFVAGIPDPRAFPVDVWRKLYGQVLREAGCEALGAGAPGGEPALRQSIARHVALQRGVRCSPEQVIVLTSSQQAMALSATLLFDEGECFAMEDPCYGGARRAYEASGLILVPVPVDAQGIRTDVLRRADKVRGVYVTPSHQYPTGATLSLARRHELLAWAGERKAWVIEDDYDSEFHYDGQLTSSVQGLDTGGRTLYVGTFSKTMFPGLRLAYVVVPPPLVSAFTAARTLMDGHCPVVHQLTLARFIEDGHFSNYVRRMRGVYRARRDIFVEAFHAHLGAHGSVTAPAGGLQMLCTVDDAGAEDAWVATGSRCGIVLPALSKLYIAPPDRFGWLAGFAACTPGEISAGLRALKQAWETPRKRSR